ncbi:MAG: hypothetical protein RLZZ500_2002 [Bacteroidota bacterium]|jgi:flagellum-specific peptidoglycan hydrolase FlgJ
MNKLFFYLIVIVSLVGCGTSHPVVRTTKPVAQTTKKTDPRKVNRPNSTPVKRTTSPAGTSGTNPVGAVNSKSNEVENEKARETPSNDNQKTTEVLQATTTVKVTTAMVLAYIEKYKDIAKKDMVDYGIPASITLGQGILESGAGSGPLSTQANNHFGIKCHKEWTGPTVSYDDDAVGECFRKYSHPHESFKDHSMFLVSRERYASLFRLEQDDYKSWSKGLKAAGYATDPSYPTKLITLIEKYQLYRFDAEVLGKPVPQILRATDSTAVEKPTVFPIKNLGNQHVVAKGDTLFSIAKKYNMTVDDLKRKNNLTENAISIGQTLSVN